MRRRAIDPAEPLDMTRQGRRIGPELVIGGIGHIRRQSIVLGHFQLLRQSVGTGARKPQARHAVDDFLAPSAAVGDNHWRPHGLGFQHGQRLALEPQRGEHQHARLAHQGLDLGRRFPTQQFRFGIKRRKLRRRRPIAGENRDDPRLARRFSEAEQALFRRQPPDEEEIAGGRSGFAPKILAIDRIGDRMDARACRQAVADHAGLKARDQDEIV